LLKQEPDYSNISVQKKVLETLILSNEKEEDLKCPTLTVFCRDSIMLGQFADKRGRIITAKHLIIINIARFYPCRVKILDHNTLGLLILKNKSI
jgi:hypothetical protein